MPNTEDSPKALTLLHLYPDEMNLYGDRGNVLALHQEALWRGISLQIKRIPLGAVPNSCIDQADIVFMGGGQDAQQFLVVEDLHRYKSKALQELSRTGTFFLTICGGYQFLGHYYKTHTGEEIRGLSLLDAYTVAGSKRCIGNVVLEVPNENGLGKEVKLLGFENHSGKTYLGEGIPALGKVLIGNGNNGEDSEEGALHHNLLGTYLHGALLPKNPILTHFILQKAWHRRYGTPLPELPNFLGHSKDFLAHKAFEEALEVAKNKAIR